MANTVKLAVRKPLEFSVMQFQGNEDDLIAVSDWIRSTNQQCMVSTSAGFEGLWIMSMSGTISVSIGDWVVQNIDDSFGKLSPADFAALYDLTE